MSSLRRLHAGNLGNDGSNMRRRACRKRLSTAARLNHLADNRLEMSSAICGRRWGGRYGRRRRWPEGRCDRDRWRLIIDDLAHDFREVAGRRRRSVAVALDVPAAHADNEVVLVLFDDARDLFVGAFANVDSVHFHDAVVFLEARQVRW